MKKSTRLIVCPYDRRGFDTLSEFISHCRKKHEPILIAEADRLTVKHLDRDTARKSRRDEKNRTRDAAAA